MGGRTQRSIDLRTDGMTDHLHMPPYTQLHVPHSKTDAGLLKAKKIGIWDGNSSREYLDSLGLTHREEGDLGPVYGACMRAILSVLGGLVGFLEGLGLGLGAGWGG